MSLIAPRPSGCLTALLCAALLGAAASARAQVTTRNFTLLANQNPYPGGINYSACWGYVHTDGREYAILGTLYGVSIYNVTNPAATYLVDSITGPFSIWREIKAYRNWVYVVTEGTGTGQGVQIIRMTDPENPVLAATFVGTHTHSHTVSVDVVRGLLICNGTRDGGGQATGLRVLSLANPEAPVEVGTWPGGPIPVPSSQYVHDSVPIGTRLYASSIYSGRSRVLDITNPAAPVEMDSWTHDGAFCHNSWPDATGNWLYVTDEVTGEPLKIFDISNLASPVLFNTFTPNPIAVVHNAHVMGSELHLSNYTEGIRALDASDPGHPAEFGWADSYPGPSGGFGGVWEVFPYFPSGTVIASDRNTGLYVYSIQRNYGLIRTRVELQGPGPLAMCGVGSACCCAPDACTCDHVMSAGAGVKVYLDGQSDSLVTTSDGVGVFAPNPGTRTVEARAFGYQSASATLPVTVGSRDTVPLTLVAKPTTSYSGTVKSATTQAALRDAEVNLAYTPVHLHTDSLGAFAGASIPVDAYHVEVRRPGYAPIVFDRPIGPGPVVQHFLMNPAPIYDDLEAVSGWTIGAPGDNATQGIWVRVDPLGTGSAPAIPSRSAVQAALEEGEPLEAWSAASRGRRVGKPRRPGMFHEGHGEESSLPSSVQPENDRTPPPGTMCFVTGQGTNPNDPGDGDVDGGRTTLTSPVVSATGMTTPAISFWHWFVSNGDPVEDYMTVSVSNDAGATWHPVVTYTGIHDHWMETSFRVADYVTPTSQVRVRFQAAELGIVTILEAAVDDFAVYDAALPSAGTGPGAEISRLAFRAPAPNPSAAEVRLSVLVPRAGQLEVEVTDLQGRRVSTLFRGTAQAGPMDLRWDGRRAGGGAAPAGIYFARAKGEAGSASARFVRVR